jgi:hypothetical protein
MAAQKRVASADGCISCSFDDQYKYVLKKGYGSCNKEWKRTNIGTYLEEQWRLLQRF